MGKCDFTINGVKEKCASWVFDTTYYKTTLTEEVSTRPVTRFLMEKLEIFKLKQWGMVCDKALWRANVQTIYFSGILVGSLVLGILSDKYAKITV